MNYSYLEKECNIETATKITLAKTLSMFSYENLPETIPQKELEKLLQTCGVCFITEFDGSLYAFNGSKGGEQDAYGNPKKFNIANAWLNFNETLDIEKDGVLFKNDDMELGLLPIIVKHHTLLIENEVSMNVNSINSRIQTVFIAGDDKTKLSADNYFKKVLNGELSAVGDTALFESMRVNSSQSSNTGQLTNLIEYNQYLKASLHNELGMKANFNMKRERLNSSEVAANDDAIYPLIQNMLNKRIEAVEQINAKYGTEISVKFGGVWADKDIEETEQPEQTEHTEQPEQTEHTEQPEQTEQTDSIDYETQIKELEDIINDENSSTDDIETAKELLEEINFKKGSENVA